MNLARQFPIKSGLILLIAFLGISVWMIIQYADKERQRDLMSWQSRLGILADIKVAQVQKIIQQKKAVLEDLAVNPSLQLYLTQHQQAGDKQDDVLQAQLSYVRNLLRATADRLGMSIAGGGALNTEHQTSRYEGLAVFDNESRPVLSTRGLINDNFDYQAYIASATASGKPAMIDMMSVNGVPVYGFVMPVYPIQHMQSGSVLGVVVALLDPQGDIYEHLKNLHLDTRTDETLLFKAAPNSLVFISPLEQGFKLFHQVPRDAQSAINYAFTTAGGFAQKTDYRGRQVLLTSRPIQHTGWMLMQKIDADEALYESNKHQRFLLTTFSLLTLFVTACFIAVWRHSTSVRLQKITVALETRTALLNAVSDNINEHIFLLDQHNDFVFANLSLAACLGVRPEDFAGKNMASVLGVDVAEQLCGLHCERDTGSLPCTLALPLGKNQASTYHVSTVTLTQGEYRDAKLYVLHDITRLQEAQEKRDRLARGIISTLVKAVDLHDPYCVDHSERTREVATGIASALGLPIVQINALEMAALLANIGKLFVPRDILVKMEPLTGAENEILKKHIDFAVDVLKQLEFEGPVLEIISQKHENLDGSGYPRGIAGEQILLEARILAVANAFVAMASSRAYRPGRPIQQVIDILLQQADRHYDRHVLAALHHIAENKTDWHRWQVVNQAD